MSIIRVQAQMQCDNPKCGIVYDFFAANMREVRAKAKKNGWDSTTGKDYCVNCADERRKKASP